jgi:hypothetical protein
LDQLAIVCRLVPLQKRDEPEVAPVDWKYKHFAEAAIFPADRQIVHQAILAFANDWLAGWKVAATPEGIEARGRSAGHMATARFRTEPVSGGSKVVVALAVERASPLGFMLVDVGGYYNRQIFKWLRALPWWIQQAAQAQVETGQSVPPPPPMPKPSRGADLFMGCALSVFLLGVGMLMIAALVGLLTGNLFIAGGSGTMVYGLWARVLSAIFLLFFGWFFLGLWRSKKGKRGSGWLPPP